jgi:hypothetical protein
MIDSWRTGAGNMPDELAASYRTKRKTKSTKQGRDEMKKGGRVCQRNTDAN